MLKWLLMFGFVLYYCLPQGEGFFCKPVDFEIKTFGTDRQMCKKVGDNWECKPFPKGTKLLEDEKSCPTPTVPQYWFNSDNLKLDSLNITPTH